MLTSQTRAAQSARSAPGLRESMDSRDEMSVMRRRFLDESNESLDRSLATRPAKRSTMRLLIVIVNYRTGDLTVDCLASLAADGCASQGARVIVVDNCSADGSAERIEDAIASRGWAEWASVLRQTFNGGFSAGNNAAIRQALSSANPPQYFLLLNSDTYVRPGAVAKLVDYLDQHSQVGIVGSRLEHPDGTPQHSLFRFPTFWSSLDEGLRWGPVSRRLARYVTAPAIPDQSCPIDWVSGACMLVRREVFEQVGLLDEQYFLYFEELDFCLRAVRAGWPSHYEPASRVVHLVGRSTGVTVHRRPERRPRYWFDSRRRFFAQHYGRLPRASMDLIWVLTYPLWYFRARLQRKPIADPPWLWWDFLRHSVFWRGFSD